jgi:hypothetical protein
MLLAHFKHLLLPKSTQVSQVLLHRKVAKSKTESFEMKKPGLAEQLSFCKVE